MAYKVKEIFYTLQGEGFHTGRPAVFCRFTGCNLWSGLEKHRGSAVCQFCDTDFLGGETYTDALALAVAINDAFAGDRGRFVVFTGGEPALQLDEDLIKAVKGLGFEVAIETNGTIDLPDGIDWVCVSPKHGSELKVVCGNELKLVYPQTGQDPVRFVGLSFNHFYLQPMDGCDGAIEKTIQYCMNNAAWRLSIQVHKVVGLR